MLRHTLRFAAALIAAAVIGTGSAAAAPAANLDELLDQTKNARAEEAKENAARVAKFQADFSQQNALLGQARAEKAAEERRAADLGHQFDANEKKLTDLQAQLDLKAGTLGEMFGVVRQSATDFSSTVHNSMISAQYPEREDFIYKLSQTKALPSIDDLERFWFEMQREMTETGNVVKFKSKVVQADGTPEDSEVVRVGPFVAVAGKKYLSYVAADHSFQVQPRQPDEFASYAKKISNADSGYAEAAIDPTRGVLLQLYAQRPNLWERIQKGELVGYVIIFVGLVGAGLGIFQFKFLWTIRAAVRRQLGALDNPSTDNPLGRVLATFKGDAAKANEDAEIVELRISEAVLREVPVLERFQPFLRLAVAAGPLLGLIGTVVGMIKTFQSITESGSSDPKLMAAGISQAMIATVLGLGIAIPLLFLNSALASFSRQIVQILDEQSTGLLAEKLEGKRRA